MKNKAISAGLLFVMLFQLLAVSAFAVDTKRPSLQIPIILRCCLASLTAWTGPQARRRLELLRLMVFQPHIRPQALKNLTVPTLVIAGTRDMIRDSHTRRIHASLPNAELVILPGDHFIARSNAQAFREAVEAFLLRE